MSESRARELQQHSHGCVQAREHRRRVGGHFHGTLIDRCFCVLLLTMVRVFQYTEFTAYAALLAGAPPHTLEKSLVVQHRQTWKLREHHLLSSDCCGNNPLPGGNPLRSYFPMGTEIKEDADGVAVREPTGPGPLQYHRATVYHSTGRVQSRSRVQDIIITGEGHSAWGQFDLVGRVRPCDGFISISKEYVDGDRGKWLYRGYLVGDVNGQLAGRWRDTLSPPDVAGYEGCFNMSRRR